jgi:DNA-binding transcriptional LysR family regulator
METDARILGGIATLSAVVESGSFVKAAKALGVTQSAVSRAIGKLEVRIGIRLFHRTTRTVKLTAESRQFYEEIAPLVHGIENAVTSASGAGVSVKGHLRVNIDPLFSRLLVAPAIGKLLDRYPELSLELVTRSLPGDLVSEGFASAIRLRHRSWFESCWTRAFSPWLHPVISKDSVAPVSPQISVAIIAFSSATPLPGSRMNGNSSGDAESSRSKPAAALC